MTAEPYPYPVICGARESRDGITYECVQPPSHTNQAHTWVRLNRTDEVALGGCAVSGGEREAVCACRWDPPFGRICPDCGLPVADFLAPFRSQCTCGHPGSGCVCHD